MKTIILTGGGTAGHVFGNIALLKKLETAFDEIVYIGGNGIEKQILKDFPNVKFFEIPTTKFVRNFTLKNLAIPFVLLKSFLMCKKIISQTKPNVVFSKGGYVSIPVVFAASSKKVPVICHESDLSLGLANRLTQNKAKVVCTSFYETAKNLKNGVWTGSPIRPQIFCGNKQLALKNLNISTNLPILLVVGGSLGASFLNNLVFENLDFLCEHFFVVHLTGKNKTKNVVHKNYKQIDYEPNIQNLLSITNFAITRGGSNAIFEFLALKIPMLIVPLSKKISRGDQIENANFFKNQGYAEVMFEENKNEFCQNVKKLLQNCEKIKKNMQNYTKTSAIDQIFQQILTYSKN